MNFQKVLLVFLTLILLSQCTSPATDSTSTSSTSSTEEKDVHSYAQPEKAKTTHLFLDLETDFEKKYAQRLLNGSE